jgi:hypothetical protein
VLAVLAVLAVLVACLPASLGAAATRAEGLSTAGPRVAALPPGLSAAEQSSLLHAGAFSDKPIHLLIVGDSIALTLGEGLSVNSQSDYGVTIDDNATLGCDLEPQLQIHNTGVVSADVQGCGEWRGLWPFLVERLRPQVVALGLGRWEVTDHLLHGRWVHIGEPVWDKRLTSDLEQAIAILHSFGARVVLLTMPYIDPTQRQANGKPYDEDIPARAQAYNALVRKVARQEPHAVSVIDLNHLLAPGGAYAPTLEGIEVRSSDGVHISPAGGELLQSKILPAVAGLGLAAEPAVAAGAAASPAKRSAAAGTRTHG